MLWALHDTPALKQPPKLLDQVRAVIRTKPFSDCTQEAYTHRIKRSCYFMLDAQPAKVLHALKVNTFLFDFSKRTETRPIKPGERRKHFLRKVLWFFSLRFSWRSSAMTSLRSLSCLWSCAMRSCSVRASGFALKIAAAFSKNNFFH